ncbi:uncharacterized protein LOC135157340 [Lytechinus pictus]|uniref:uncharacterized protein LOC135157340 n=1 Tax=Lytechinus pictus TaxID=7653 RepID=UPI0030B9BDB1
MAVVDDFITPPKVTVSEARGSPKKKRLSVEGNLIEVGVLTETPDYKRRQLKLAEPGDDGHIISLTLWGEQAVADITPGLQVCCSAVIREENGLRASPSTKIEFKNEIWLDGIVAGIRSRSTPVRVILTNGTTIKVSGELVLDFAEFLGQKIQYKVGKDGLVCELKKVE